jgi:negative regulator of flagellin synthesis FlgM
MEIKKTLLQNADPYRANLDKAQAAAARRAGQTGPETAGRAQGDVVTVSPEAVLRTEAYRTANAAPDIRREKVENIKERISSGAYTPDSRKIAQKLLESDAFLASALGE